MQKFFKDTIVSSFIKEFVYSQNIPSCTTAIDGDFVVENTCYIYKNQIIRVTKEGKIGSNAEFKVVRNYRFNEKISKITENFFSRYNYYDPETHYHLGNYLRLLRDCRGIDLMPLYNCFNYKIVNDIYLGNKDEILSIGDNKRSLRTKDKKIVLIPIRFGKKYTICIDSFSGFRVKPVFYGQFGRIIDIGLPKDFIKFENEESVSSSSFKTPFIYECNFLESGTYDREPDQNNTSTTGSLTPSQKTRLKSLEKYLYLLIQLPINNKSSILVQEGEYDDLATFAKQYKIREDDYIHTNIPIGSTLVETIGGSSVVYDDDAVKENEIYLNKLLLSKLQLQRLNTGESYPFSYRLVEYLLDNVITKDDDFGKDIERVQKALNKLNGGGFDENGVWENKIRTNLFSRYISDTAHNRSHDPIDINGFIDKDSEDYLSKVVNRSSGGTD